MVIATKAELECTECTVNDMFQQNGKVESNNVEQSEGNVGWSRFERNKEEDLAG